MLPGLDVPTLKLGTVLADHHSASSRKRPQPYIVLAREER